MVTLSVLVFVTVLPDVITICICKFFLRKKSFNLTELTTSSRGFDSKPANSADFYQIELTENDYS